jgi:5-methylcytosine-specific restriction endonuclease McrBC GTP-binding regulatory subunit McrB
MKVSTKEELRQWLEKDKLRITKSLKPQEVAQQKTDQLANSIAVSLTKLYPVYLFATSDTPLEKVEDYLEGTEEGEPDIEKFVRFVSFHQSYSYEEFVEGIRPVIADTIVGEQTGKDYEISKGIFRRICEDAKGDRDNNYFLIIDEINRGQISKIFGELITLLEKDKRLSPTGDRQENTIVLDLVYSKEPFSVPWNLYIIGTMNTADKSIALVDVALRRRFGFIEIPPEPSKLKVYLIQGINVDLPKILENINRKITVLVDRDHQIGHSYLMNIDKDTKGNIISEEKQILENLRCAFYNEIIPLLQEYFYNDWEKLAQVIPPFVKTILTLEKAMEEMENATQGIYEIADDLDDPAFLKALSEL